MSSGMVAVLGALAVLCLPAAGSAASWKLTQVPDGPVEGILWGVSCPSGSMCVAVGTNSVIASTTDPSGDGSGWETVHPEGYVGSGGIIPGNALKGVSCPSTGLCVVAGPQGNIWASADPTGDVSAWVAAPLGLGATHMNAISCPSTSALRRRLPARQGDLVDQPARRRGGLDDHRAGRAAQPAGNLLSDAGLCVAVSYEGDILTSTDPTGGAAAWQVARQPAGGRLFAGVLLPLLRSLRNRQRRRDDHLDQPRRRCPWKSVAGAAGLPVTGVSCPAISACAAVDNNSDAITSTDPTGGAAAWSFETVIPVTEAENGNAFKNRHLLPDRAALRRGGRPGGRSSPPATPLPPNESRRAAAGWTSSARG